MPAATTLAVVGLALAAGTTAYSIDQGNKARKSQEEQIKKQQANQDQLNIERKQKEEQAVAQAFSTSARKRAATADPAQQAGAQNVIGAAPSTPAAASKTLIGT